VASPVEPAGQSCTGPALAVGAGAGAEVDGARVDTAAGAAEGFALGAASLPFSSSQPATIRAMAAVIRAFEIFVVLYTGRSIRGLSASDRARVFAL
jgi:hypothetical protein